MGRLIPLFSKEMLITVSVTNAVSALLPILENTIAYNVKSFHD
jgi:hypothetical protein